MTARHPDLPNTPLVPGSAAARGVVTGASFRYVVHTISAWRLTGETVAYGTSAQAVMEDFLARGYVKVEVAPAAPVNGFPELVAGVDYLPGDTAEGHAPNVERKHLREDHPDPLLVDLDLKAAAEAFLHHNDAGSMSVWRALTGLKTSEQAKRFAQELAAGDRIPLAVAPF